MHPILHQLWQDHAENIFRQFSTPQIKSLQKELTQLQEKLLASLTDEQKQLLEAYDDLHDDLQSLYFNQVFAGGYRLGARMILAATEEP